MIINEEIRSGPTITISRQHNSSTEEANWSYE